MLPRRMDDGMGVGDVSRPFLKSRNDDKVSSGSGRAAAEVEAVSCLQIYESSVNSGILIARQSPLR